MILAMIINEDNGYGWYVYNQTEVTAGKKLLISHEDMADCFVYIAANEEALETFVHYLNHEDEYDEEPA